MKKKLFVLIIILLLILSGIVFKKYHDKKIYDQLFVEFVNDTFVEYGSDLESLDLIVSNEGEIIFIDELDTSNVSKK